MVRSGDNGKTQSLSQIDRFFFSVYGLHSNVIKFIANQLISHLYFIILPIVFYDLVSIKVIIIVVIIIIIIIHL